MATPATAALPRPAAFERFAAEECPEDALYAALCRLLAQRPAALALLDAAPRTQQRPNLLLAAVHDRVLAGAGGTLAPYFPSVGGHLAPDAALAGAWDDFFAAQQAALAASIARRATQTNEIGRCAVLQPALAWLQRESGDQPLALLDFGCSAGLNLGVDRYQVRVDGRRLQHGAGPDAPVVDAHAVAGLAPPSDLPPLRLAQRLGLDPAPVDLRDDDALRWLCACVWPHDTMRLQRLRQAAALVRQADWPVRRAEDCGAAIEPWLDALPAGVQPVVFNSWVLAYFTPDALARHRRLMTDLVQRRGVAWLSAEAAALALGEAPPPGPADDRVDADELTRATQWWCLRRDASGAGGTAARATLLARSHPHGRWLQWAAGPR